MEPRRRREHLVFSFVGKEDKSYSEYGAVTSLIIPLSLKNLFISFGVFSPFFFRLDPPCQFEIYLVFHLSVETDMYSNIERFHLFLNQRNDFPLYLDLYLNHKHHYEEVLIFENFESDNRSNRNTLTSGIIGQLPPHLNGCLCSIFFRASSSIRMNSSLLVLLFSS